MESNEISVEQSRNDMRPYDVEFAKFFRGDSLTTLRADQGSSQSLKRLRN